MKCPQPHAHPGRFRTLWAGVLLAVLASAAPLAAQTATPNGQDAFDQVRLDFQRQVFAKSQPITAQYERALARIESDLAASGDFHQAAQVKKRRDQLQGLYQNAEAALAESLAIPLSAANARGLGLTSQPDGVLVGWRASTHYAEWSSIKIPPGDYFLELSYLMYDAPSVTGPSPVQPENRAMFEFFEVSMLTGSADNRRSFEIERNRDGLTYTQLKVGPISFTRSMVTLRLSATDSLPANVIQMKNLRLVPSTSNPSIAVSADDPNRPAVTSSSLETLRAGFAKALRTAHEPVIEAHIATLEQVSKDHSKWRRPISAEIRSLNKQLNQAPKSEVPSLPRPVASLGGITGFQDLEDVTFLAHPENTGDRFWVEHDGKSFQVRLLWIQCAPPRTSAEAGADTQFSRHFGLDPQDAALFGRAAQEFTAGYLEGKSFRLLARNARESDGPIPVLLFLRDVGLYQNVLIDQGLAAVIGKINPGSGTLEKALLRSLQEREVEASGREPRPGAWSLATTTPTASP